MGRGFIYNQNLCVNCSACSAACILENKWTIQPRMIYSYNSEVLPSLPVTNLSLACNHCEIPVCLTGCPTAAIYREPQTMAVIIDERRCIGCKYCQWNCPYDAPKFNSVKSVIGKCNFCYSLLIDEYLPACTTSCPTGALKFGEINDPKPVNMFSWFPDKNLEPAISMTDKSIDKPLKIIPEDLFNHTLPLSDEKERRISKEWSLFAFTSLTMISVAILISSLINGKFPNKFLFLSLIIVAGLLSFFHLGKWSGAWRAVTNLIKSPVSREIALFILYSIISLLSLFLLLPGLLLASSILGLALLIVIDSVYIFADNRRSIIFHSGQTFLSGLLIVSFLTGFVYPFVFIAGIKLVSSVYSLLINKISGIQFGLRFIRIALLIVVGVSMVSQISYSDPVILSIFIISELIDRMIFYDDFSPINIKKEIIKQINIDIDEKKRY